MSKDGTMTFRVEPELRQLFHDAAKSEHRPAAQVLRELMRGYIAQVNGQRQISLPPVIAAAERTRRQEAFNAAVTSVGLEGFTVSPEQQSAAQSFINGKVEFSEFMRNVHEQRTEDKQRLEGLYTASRIFELELHPVQGAFNAAHLKEIHRRIFQDLPGVGFHKVFPGEYRPQGQLGNDGIKTRLLESIQMTSCVAYSLMDQAAQQRLDAALASSLPEQLLDLNRVQLVKVLAALYTELDYVHPFGDGNSRTLRVFTRQLAHTVGYSLDWNHFNLSPTKRDVLYIARDKDVNELALPLLHDRQTQRHVQLTLDHFSANPGLADLLDDVIHPLGSSPTRR